MGCGVSNASGASQVANFDDAVLGARKKSRTEDFNSEATSRFETYSGDFDVQYMDRGRTQCGFANITLSNNGMAGYAIRGDCGDVDGRAQIVDGLVCFNGAAWWVEQIVSGADTGLKTLTEGTFDFARNTFTGRWNCSNGLRGRYTQFKGKNISITASPAIAVDYPTSTLASMLEEDIPMVVAKPDSPPRGESYLRPLER